MRHSVRFLVLIIWLASTTCSVAEIVRFDIDGTLRGIFGLDPPPPDLPAIGSAFSGSFVLRIGDWEWKETGETPVTIVVGNDVIRGPLPEIDSYFVGIPALSY
jgi:hypothetical protein